MTGWSKDRIETRQFRRNRSYVRKRDNGLCVRCWTLFKRISVATDCDHLINVAQGGSDYTSNLWMLCNDCHWEKTKREQRGLPGFGHIIGLDGWPLEGDSIEDWQRVIEKRNAR